MLLQIMFIYLQIARRIAELSNKPLRLGRLQSAPQAIYSAVPELAIN